MRIDFPNIFSVFAFLLVFSQLSFVLSFLRWIFVRKLYPFVALLWRGSCCALRNCLFLFVNISQCVHSLDFPVYYFNIQTLQPINRISFPPKNFPWIQTQTSAQLKTPTKLYILDFSIFDFIGIRIVIIILCIKYDVSLVVSYWYYCLEYLFICSFVNICVFHCTVLYCIVLCLSIVPLYSAILLFLSVCSALLYDIFIIETLKQNETMFILFSLLHLHWCRLLVWIN